MSTVDTGVTPVEIAKVSSNIMVSAAVGYEGKGRLYFRDEKAEVNDKHYVVIPLSKHVEDCCTVVAKQFIFNKMEGSLTAQSCHKID